MKSAWLAPTVLLLAAAGAVPSPRGTVRARIEGLLSQSMPREISVRVRPTRQVQGYEKLAWETEVTCPVRNGEWICDVPAGRVDLRFQGAAMAPVYKWGQTVRAGETTDLGTLLLRRGASIAGWVQLDRKEIPAHAILVTLEPRRIGGGMLGLYPKELRTARLESNSRPWGFFHFEKVLPGEYFLIASEPGQPKAWSSLIRIEGERSFELPEPIVLRPWPPLSVRIDPPRDPYGDPWKPTLYAIERPFPEELKARGRSLDGVEQGRGSWSFGKLPPGEYELRVSGPSEVLWHRQRLQVAPGRGSFDIRIPTVWTTGQVTYQGEPLAVRLGVSGARSSRQIESDAQGRFSTWLTREEEWTVRVEMPGLEPVVLEDKVRMARSGRLDIRVPDTRLTVDVVDEEGRRVPRAWVNVYGEIRNQGPADDLGRFEIVGLNPGPKRLLVGKLDPHRQAEEIPIQVKAGGRTPPVRVVLPNVLDLRGRVLPRFGSAAGARVVTWSTALKDRMWVYSTEADEDGEVRLSLPLGTQTASLLVYSPGSALRILQPEVRRERLLEMPVEVVGGTLVLEGLPDEVTEYPGPKDRKFAQTRYLRQWADWQGTSQAPGRLVVPNVEPGPYHLCPTAPWIGRGEAPADGKCVSGVLEASGELVLRLPSPPDF